MDEIARAPAAHVAERRPGSVGDGARGQVMGAVKGKAGAALLSLRVRRNNTVNYALREEKVPDSWFYNFPGVTFELVDSYADRDSATRAWRRMEHRLRNACRAEGRRAVADPADVGRLPCRPRR